MQATPTRHPTKPTIWIGLMRSLRKIAAKSATKTGLVYWITVASANGRTVTA